MEREPEMAELRDGARSTMSRGNRTWKNIGMHVGLSKNSQHCQPREVRAMNFPLPSAGRDNPQGSFDCHQQAASSRGALQPKVLTQAEKASRHPEAKAADPEGPFPGLQLNSSQAESRQQAVGKGTKALPILAKLKALIGTGKKTEVRKAPQANPQPVNEGKTTKIINPFWGVFSRVSRRPFRDRVIHLLALKNYKKPELLARLQRDGIMPEDRDSLGKILHQVANLNPRDNSFHLKEDRFKDLQKDWPGYSDVDRLALEKILASKSAPSPNATSASHSASQGPPDADAPSRTSQKRPLDSTSTCPVMAKKQRIGRLAFRVQPANGGLCPVSSVMPPKVLQTPKPSKTVRSIFRCSSGVRQKDLPRTLSGVPAPAMVPGQFPKFTERKEGRKKLSTAHLLDFTEGVKETFPASTDPASSREQPDDFICGALQLSHGTSVQNKVTAGRTSSSDEPIRKRPSQAEKESANQSPRVIRPHRPFLGKKAEVRRAPQANPDPVPERKRTTPLNPANFQRISSAVSRQPFRDRVIHLLALKDYKKPELLEHLQRDGIMPHDRDSLGEILHQVANLNPRDNSFHLKEDRFKDLQKDWPGYSEADRQALEKILARKSAPSPNATSASLSTSQGPSDAPSRTSQKRPLDSSSTCPVKGKRQRVGHLACQVQPASGDISPASSAQPPTVLLASKPSENVTSILPCSPEVQKETPSIPSGIPVDGVQETFPASTDPALTREQPEHFIKYTAIVSLEQRQSYEDDFNAGYGEYQTLLAQVDNITKTFREFDEQRKLVTPGSTAYEVLVHQVRAEYQKIQERSPSFSDLKKRCQCLHNKLSHIKRLIQEFDRQQEQSWHQSSSSASRH